MPRKWPSLTLSDAGAYEALDRFAAYGDAPQDLLPTIESFKALRPEAPEHQKAFDGLIDDLHLVAGQLLDERSSGPGPGQGPGQVPVSTLRAFVETIRRDEVDVLQKFKRDERDREYESRLLLDASHRGRGDR